MFALMHVVRFGYVCILCCFCIVCSLSLRKEECGNLTGHPSSIVIDIIACIVSLCDVISFFIMCMHCWVYHDGIIVIV